MYRILQQTIQARIQALLSERYGVELAQLGGGVAAEAGVWRDGAAGGV